MTYSDPKRFKIERLFSPWMLGLCAVGLLLNLALSKLVLWLGWPLYLDNVGSILTAALGGALPGMAVGFLSNVIGSFTEPISMYYGILTIIIAWLASLFSQRGWLKKWRGALIASGSFVLIGGAAGSLMTWFLYGGGIGGIAEPYALAIHSCGIPEFFSQLSADILVDIPDKLLTVGIVCLLLRFLPRWCYQKFPLSDLYDREKQEQMDREQESDRQALRHSVNARMVAVLAIAVSVTSVTAVTVGTVYHHQRLIGCYETLARAYSHQAASVVNGDMVEEILQGGAKEQYEDIKMHLTALAGSSDDIAYVYVYSVREDGCHVVIDLDTPDVPGEEPGALVENEQYFFDNEELFLSGAEVPAEYTNGEYGPLITGYTTVKDSGGHTVAYAGVDISIESYIIDMMTSIIQVVSILFAIALLIFAFALWHINRHITMPLRTIVDQSRALDRMTPEKWLDSAAWNNRVPIRTGDELEELYCTVCKVEENASLNVRRLIETKQQLLQTKELERINRELAVTIKAADDANRAKTEFLSRMSHDIRTPLNAILGTAALAQDELTDPAAMAESLGVITSSGRFLLGLINDILDINKIESGSLELRPEVYDVREFINSVNSTIRPLAEKKNLTFIFEMKCGHSAVFVDKLRYKQIFFNLLSNAIKYTPEGGRVEFIAVALEAPEGVAGVRNIIRDTGIGMSKEYMKHLYEPFTRDKNAVINQTEGSGLGLAIVKNIVDAMEGSIEVHSEQGKGTEFIVDLYLPLADANNLPQDACQWDGRALQKGLRVLLVEDNAVNTKIAKKFLEKQGCIVTAVENGQEALECFEQRPAGEFELIFMDIRMPVMDGLEATRRIRILERADAKTIPIIAMTANAYAEDVRQSLDAGMNDHLAKPIEPEKLYRVIAKYAFQK
ncbi:MAG: response regulator [Oscillospiraceae bacterium]|nr:response regulator [Oscillospiraceae bacterium]